MSIWNTQRDVDKPITTELGDFSKTPRYARIVNVYDANCLGADKDKYGKIEVVWLEGGGSPRELIPFTLPWFSWSRGSGIMFMPEQNDVVVCLQRTNGYPVIIGFIPHNWKNTTVESSPMVALNTGNTRPLFKGEICIKGSAGNEIVLDKLGNVNITSVDTSLSENVVVNEVGGVNTENIFTRTQDKVNSLQSNTVVGNSYLYDGTPVQVGNADQVFESGVYNTAYSSMTVTYEGKAVDIPIPSDTFITRIDSISFTKDNTKLVPLKEDKDYIISCQTVYNRGNDNPNEIGYKPATTERNTVIYTINPVSNLMKKYKGSLVIKYYTKSFVGGVRVNRLGDLFLDGRNVIIRSAQEKASLSVTDDGEALLRGSANTTIGNSYAGTVKCDDSGVAASYGVGATEEAIKSLIKEDKLNTKGSYYYIDDNFPLIKLYKDGDTWKFTAVTDSEYSSLDLIDRAGIKKIWVSETTTLLTLEKAKSLLVDNVSTYGDLKRVRN